MDRFQALTAFARVVETGSFARAAERLGVSVSSVSRLVADLEAHLDARLLNRTTRRLSLTESGQAFFERCVQLLADLEEAEVAVTAASIVPRGTLRLTCSATFGARHLAPAIAAFAARHPQMRFDVELSERVVAPSYLARHGEPLEPEDLTRHACLTYEYAANRNVWSFRDGKGGERQIRIEGPIHANSGRFNVALAVEGLGIAREPDFIVGPDVKSGRLKPILCRFEPPPLNIYVVYPSRRHLSAKVRAFADFLVERFAMEQWGLPAEGPAARQRRKT
jgi:DNA-binding transcriptional LysR family regulator